MQKNLLLVVVLGLSACQLDYKVHTSDDNLGGDDTAAPVQDDPPEQTEEDTGEDDYDPPKDENGPIAVCDVSPNPVEPPFEKAAWDGSGSYDTAGGTIVDYSWELTSKPAGSTVLMPSGGAIRSNFQPDLAGDYIGKLTVTNDQGVTDSCETTLESIPAQNLWIEMYWTERPDDMDLHLIRDGGQLNSRDDCYWSNCTNGLSWGANGAQDDPSLDLDDIEGLGPENINISEPENVIYSVAVHDYYLSNWPASDVTSGNDVTVNIYINGSLEWTDTRTIAGDDTVTYFAEIDWQNGSVNPL